MALVLGETREAGARATLAEGAQQVVLQGMAVPEPEVQELALLELPALELPVLAGPQEVEAMVAEWTAVRPMEGWIAESRIATSATVLKVTGEPMLSLMRTPAPL